MHAFCFFFILFYYLLKVMRCVNSLVPETQNYCSLHNSLWLIARSQPLAGWPTCWTGHWIYSIRLFCACAHSTWHQNTRGKNYQICFFVIGHLKCMCAARPLDWIYLLSIILLDCNSVFDWDMCWVFFIYHDGCVHHLMCCFVQLWYV